MGDTNRFSREAFIQFFMRLLGIFLMVTMWAGAGSRLQGAVTVISPNGGEVWSVGLTHAITWTASLDVINVAIDYTTDSGGTWLSLTASTPNTGSYDWVAPANPGVFWGIRISNADNPADQDTSNNVFMLTADDDVYEENDDRAHATSLTAGTYEDLRFIVDEVNYTSTDEDWYKVYLDAGQDLCVTIIAQPLTPGVTLDVDLELQDASGNVLVQAIGSGATETVCLADQPAGWYYIHDLGSYDNNGLPVSSIYSLTMETGDLTVGTISGRVTNTLGAGIPQVRVEFNDPSGNWALLHGTVVTDSNGDYEFSYTAGNCIIYYNTVVNFLNYVAEYYNDRPTFQTADPVTVVSGTTTTCDAVLATGGMISGHVTRQSDGGNLLNVNVRAYDPVSRILLRSAYTDTFGNYTIVGVRAGDVKVRFNRNTFGTEWYNDKTSFGDGDLITVSAGGTVTGIDAALANQGRLQGMVFDDATGNPVTGVSVRAIDLSNFLISSVNTNSSGYYNLPNMPTSQVKVVVVGESLGYASEWLYNRATFELADPIQVTSGFTATNGNVYLDSCTQIVLQPMNQSVTPGGSATLTVTAFSTQTLSYQWYEGLSGDTSVPISGAIYSSWSTPPLVAGVFPYWVRVIAPCRTVDSDTVYVTVVAECLTPSAPAVTVPAVAGYDEDYLLAWTDTCPEGYYEGQEALLPDFAVFEHGYLTGTSLSLSHNPPEPTYYFYRIRAVRVCDGTTYLSDWSAIRHVAVTGSAFEPADIDLNGAVNAADVVLLAAYLAGSNDLAAAAAADLDGDAVVGATDLDFLLHFLVGNFKRAPAGDADLHPPVES